MRKKPGKRPPCKIAKVWGYPATPEEMRPGGSMIHYAWGCECGRHGDSYETDTKAQEAADKHFGAREVA